MGKTTNIEKYESTYERHRLNILANLIPAATNYKDKQYALDIACGPGVFSTLLTKKGYNTVGIDINSLDLNVAKKSVNNASFMKMDALHLGFKDSAFDLVLGLEILEHFEKPNLFISELLRVCKNGGTIVISTPNRYSLEGVKGKLYEKITTKKWVAWDNSHKTILTSKQLLDMLKETTSIKKTIGYYYIPKIHVNIIDSIFDPIRYLHTQKKPFNLFGFNVIILSKKL